MVSLFFSAISIILEMIWARFDIKPGTLEIPVQGEFLEFCFEFIPGRDALPEAGELQFPLHREKSLLCYINQVTDFIFFLHPNRCFAFTRFKRRYLIQVNLTITRKFPA